MAFWIVYQGRSWARAREGGYLWAPKIGKHRRAQHYWDNMERVRPGDLIFSGFNNALRAVSQAAAPAYPSTRPDLRDTEYWQSDGWRLDVAYTDLPKPLFYSDWLAAVHEEIPLRHGPFSRKQKPNQGYLYELPLSVGQFLLDKVLEFGVDIAAETLEAATNSIIGDTVRKTLTSARIGQGKFRDDLMEIWKKQCAVSQVSRPELLRASHIKPWRCSNNQERLDPANGILLSASYDAAFDAFLISFDDDGSIVLARDLDTIDVKAMGIKSDARLSHLDDKIRAYLKQHREMMDARVRISEGKA